MTDDAAELAEEAVAYRLLADALLARSKDLAKRAAAAMKTRGTLFPRLPDGTELATFNIPADAKTVDIDEVQLLPFVQEHYPTEVMVAIRPAFLELIRVRTKEAEQPCGPGGELDLPGVAYSLTPGSPRITTTSAGKERARAAVDAVLARALSSFATPQIEEAS